MHLFQHEDFVYSDRCLLNASKRRGLLVGRGGGKMFLGSKLDCSKIYKQ